MREDPGELHARLNAPCKPDTIKQSNVKLAEVPPVTRAIPINQTVEEIQIDKKCKSVLLVS